MVDLEILTFPLFLHGALVTAMTAFIAMVLGYEVDLPLVIAVPMAFFIALFGYATSWVFNFVVDVPMLWALTGQGIVLLAAAGLYDAMT